jgi:hypothetical protein
MFKHGPDGKNSRHPANAAIPRADPSAQEKLAKLLVLKNLQGAYLIRLEDKGDKPPQLHGANKRTVEKHPVPQLEVAGGEGSVSATPGTVSSTRSSLQLGGVTAISADVVAQVVGNPAAIWRSLAIAK